MRIDAAALVADQFRFEDEAAGGKKDHVALGRSGGVTGFYELGAAHVVDAQAVVLDVTSALWHIEGGHAAATKPSRLDGVILRLDVPVDDAATTMHLEVSSGTLGGIAYVDGDLTVEGAGTATGAVVDLLADGTLSVAVAKLVLHDVRVISGTTTVAIAKATLEDLRVVSRDDSLDVRAARADLVGITTSLEGTPLEVGQAVAEAASYQDGHIRVGQTTVTSLTVDHAFPAASPSTAPPEPLPDVAALDAIEGVVSIDVKVTADVPVLPDHTIAQTFRIPIENGAISYAALEHGLPVLGDAIVDFEVQGDELLFELDVVPIVKLDNVTLVSWSLADPLDRDLAKQKRVRLRRLVQFRTPSAPSGALPSSSSKKKAFRLLGIDLGSIDVALSMPRPSVIPIGDGRVELTKVDAVKVTGALHVAVEGAPARGQLDATVGGVQATLVDVAVGPLKNLRAATIASFEPIRVAFDDLSPTNARGTIREARIQGLSVDLA